MPIMHFFSLLTEKPRSLLMELHRLKVPGTQTITVCPRKAPPHSGNQRQYFPLCK